MRVYLVVSIITTKAFSQWVFMLNSSDLIQLTRFLQLYLCYCQVNFKHFCLDIMKWKLWNEIMWVLKKDINHIRFVSSSWTSALLNRNIWTFNWNDRCPSFLESKFIFLSFFYKTERMKKIRSEMRDWSKIVL